MLTITNSSEYNLNGFKNIIIVPETFSHNYERFLCEKYGNSISKSTEVLTFKRISDRIFAEIGGFANNYINDSGRVLAMYNAINSVFTTLKIYNSNKIDVITKILATIDEFKMYKITENDLLLASKEFSGTLKSKILDLYMIYTAYNKITENEIQDPRQELEFLCENYHKCSIYDNHNVYFDKFDGFTPQQYSLLTEMLRKNINITITLDIKDQSSKLYDLSKTSRTTFEHLKLMCNRHSFELKCDFKEVKRKKFEEISENLFEIEPVSIKNEDVTMHISTTLQNECLYTAGKIIEIIHSNSDIRFSDIIVTARNFDEYHKQLQVAFERYNIPVFIAKKDDIMKKIPIKLLNSAINLILSNYKTQNAFEYLKSPILNIDNTKICSLEDYILRWNINYLQKSQVFFANPSFNLRKVNENEQIILDDLNLFKNEILAPIYQLDSEFKKCKTGSDFITAMYSFCERIELNVKILNYNTESNTIKQEYNQLWDIIVDSFDQFFDISGTQEMSFDEFAKLYGTLICSYEISEIPSSIDNITAGGFERIIGEECKILFILGCDSDNLPCKLAENPILNDEDRFELENLELEMSPFGEDLIIREFELISNIFSLPKEKLYLSYSEVSTSKNTVSSIFKRVAEIVLDIEKTTDLSVDYDFMYKSKNTALEFFAINKNIEQIEKINEEIARNQHKGVINRELIEKLYSKNISPSRIETQNGCRFRYFMQYGLKANPRKIIRFNQMENGNFIHFILEKVLNEVDYENIDITQSVDKYIEFYSEEYFSKNVECDPKFEYIFNKLKKNTHSIVTNIIDEIKASEFKPTDFELEINHNSEVKPLKVGDFSIIGKVDRIDVFTEDGKSFLRVIDYKSGVKKLDLSAFYHGINMQMFIYLLTLEQNENYQNSAYPTGALYVPTKMPKLSLDMPISNAEVEKMIHSDLKRSGLLLENKRIIEKMEKNSPFLYLPVKLNKDESFSKTSSSVASEERFKAMKNFVREKLVEITNDFFSGETSPNPYIFNNKSSCDYCDFSSSCGFSTNYDTKKSLENIKNDEFWEKLGV